MRLSDDLINKAKEKARLLTPRHEHSDCIRMAFEWLDAQNPTKTTRIDDWKHIIERWCGRYITDDDVNIAASMHNRISGRYPKLNIGSRLVFPSTQRLWDIREAGKHNPPGGVGSPSIYQSMEADIH